MRYLTRAWARGFLSDQECEKREHDHETNRAKILSQLPIETRTCVETITLHDAELRAVRVSKSYLELFLKMYRPKSDDYQDGILRYHTKLDAETLAQIAAMTQLEKKPEILYNEIHSDGVHWRHELLFHPVGEVAIPFTAMQWEPSEEIPEHPFSYFECDESSFF